MNYFKIKMRRYGTNKVSYLFLTKYCCIDIVVAKIYYICYYIKAQKRSDIELNKDKKNIGAVLNDKKEIMPEYYAQDIEEYKNYFESALNDIIDALISADLTKKIKSIEARIKSYASFKHNLYTKNRIGNTKKMDDCFGVKITLEGIENDYSKNEEDDENKWSHPLMELKKSKSKNDRIIYSIIMSILHKNFDMKKLKDHSKVEGTNYNAVHAVFGLKGTTIPFEIQIRTPERSRGRLPHDIYKYCGPDSELSESEQKEVVLNVFEKIMKLNLNGKYNAYRQELPIYSYEVEDITGNPKIKRLTDKEMLIKLFPTISNLLSDSVQDYRSTDEDETGIERFSNMLDALLLQKGENINGRKQRGSKLVFNILHKLTDDTLEDRKRKEALLIFDQVTSLNRRINKAKNKLTSKNNDDPDPADNF